MTKDLEQLRLNMIRTLMEMDQDGLMRIKEFLESESNSGWEEQINDKNVEFIDYTKISKPSKKDDDKTKIIFL